ncbi:hypothetical protein IJJ02_03005 [Candidatus Saccharibacteria bacterium]|nr:hypothetical protein [Candidatus Saccharibacteria bacterium]
MKKKSKQFSLKQYHNDCYDNKVLLSIPTILSIPLVLFSVTVLSFIALTSPSSSADSSSVVDAVEVTVKAACTMKGGADGTSDSGMTITDTITPGNYADYTGSKLTTVCNDSGGYSIYAIGYSGSTYNTPTNTQMINSSDSSYNFNTGTATSGNTSNWSMRLNTINGSAYPTIMNDYDNVNFKVIPATYTQVAKYTAITAEPTSTGAQVQTNYRVYVSPTQVAGTYQGKVKYTMVHPNDIVTGSNTDMQNWHGCSNLDPGSETFLKDTRDNKYYRITKFYDGKCWMTENLDLAGGTALSADDTDVTGTYINGFETGGNLTKVGNTIVLPASSTTGFDDDTKAFVYNSGNASNDCSAPGCYSYYSWIAATLGGKASDGITTVTSADAAASICPKGWRLPNTRSGGDSTSDFRALMIALGGSSLRSYWDADSSPTGATIFNDLSSIPLNFLRAGSYASNKHHEGENKGVYWSSTPHSSSTVAYLLHLSSTEVYSAGHSSNAHGYSVRCLTE